MPNKLHEDGCAWADVPGCSGLALHEWNGGNPECCRFCFMEYPEEICVGTGCLCWCHDDAWEAYEAMVIRNLVAERGPKT